MYENGFLDPAYITPEEQQILDGNIAVQKNLYTSKQDFVVESDKFLEHSEDDITLRRHTRFVDFPKHKHDYVEIFYCLSGSVTHVINEEEICLRHRGTSIYEPTYRTCGNSLRPGRSGH